MRELGETELIELGTEFLRAFNQLQIGLTEYQRMPHWEVPAAQQQRDQGYNADASENQLSNPPHRLGQVGNDHREQPPEQGQDHTEDQQADEEREHGQYLS